MWQFLQRDAPDPTLLPIRSALHLRRIAGGSQTDVYQTPDEQFVCKVRSLDLPTIQAATSEARWLQTVAAAFTAYLGPQHTIPSHYVLTRDQLGRICLLIIQPYVAHARPLADTDRRSLPVRAVQHVATQLRDLLRRSLVCYRATGHMPDLHGGYGATPAERSPIGTLAELPRRTWYFFVRQNVLLAHNLLITGAPDYVLVLVDYDPVRWRGLPGQLYYFVRWMLLWRDHLAIWQLERQAAQAAHRSRQIVRVIE